LHQLTKPLIALAAVTMSLFAVPAVATAETAEPQLATATVHLRVQGSTGPLFSGLVTTSAHLVTTASGGTHECDGTNNNANATPGPTVTGTLDDAAIQNNITWDAIWSDQFDDFFITRIAAETNTNRNFWQYWINGRYGRVGGCQQQVHSGDVVVWAFIPPLRH